MPTDHILALLTAERDKLSAAIAALQGEGKTRGRPAAISVASVSEGAPTPRKRKVSAAARKRMAEGQKKRWAAIKAGK